MLILYSENNPLSFALSMTKEKQEVLEELMLLILIILELQDAVPCQTQHVSRVTSCHTVQNFSAIFESMAGFYCLLHVLWYVPTHCKTIAAQIPPNSRVAPKSQALFLNWDQNPSHRHSC